MKTRSTTAASEIEDPLGLAPLEAQIAWSAEGPLPSWLDGTDPPAEPNDPNELPLIEAHAEVPAPAGSRVETLAVVGEKTEPRVNVDVDVDSKSSGNRPPSSINELLDLVNLVSRCVSGEPGAAEEAAIAASHVMRSEPRGEASPSAPTARVPASASLLHLEHSMPLLTQPTTPAGSANPSPPDDRAETHLDEKGGIASRSSRRVPSLDELAESRDCLLVEAAGRCWALPLHAVVSLHPRSASRIDYDVDLAAELGDPRHRPRHARRWNVATGDRTFAVDGLRGQATIEWSTAESGNGPYWMLAQAAHMGESIGLVDLEAWDETEVTGNESEAAEQTPTLSR
jgi:hypothetical protein